jgi:predicted dithiol-disulfide oxidoreductase (DUF899 family)
MIPRDRLSPVSTEVGRKAALDAKELIMTLPDVVTREDWLESRERLLGLEKEDTRRRDALNAERRRLPMVRIEKQYLLTGPEGEVPLVGLFEDSRQLIVLHVMFAPDWDAGCPGCTAGVDEISDGLLRHLRSRDTAFALVSRAPMDKLRKYQAERDWTVPWYSSYGGDFNDDFEATVDNDERSGVSCFLRAGGEVFHTYSTWARGTDVLGSAYSWLDLTAFGRQENWEVPAGRAPRLHGADPTFTD